MTRRQLAWTLMIVQLVLLIAAVVVWFATGQAVLALGLAVAALVLTVCGGFLSRPAAPTPSDEPVPSAEKIRAYRERHPEASLGEAIDALQEGRS